MTKIKLSGCIFLALVSNSSFAGTMGEVKSCSDLSCMPWFLEFGSGVSWSNDANINVDTNVWLRTPDGYSSALGTVPLYTAGVGYTISPLVSVDASYTFRGIYNYKKHQVDTQSSVQDRTRYFNLNSNALMLNGTLYGQGWSDKLAYEMNGVGLIQPVIGGGIGVSYNTMSNFHSVMDFRQEIISEMQDLTKASFAWQLNAGLELKKDRFSFDVGYRYFNAGSFTSNNFIPTEVYGTSEYRGVLIPGWLGTLSANEIYFTAKVAF